MNSSNYINNRPTWSILNGGGSLVIYWSLGRAHSADGASQDFLFGSRSSGQIRSTPPQLDFSINFKWFLYWIIKHKHIMYSRTINSIQICVLQKLQKQIWFFFSPLVTICRDWVIDQKIWYDLPKKVLLVTYNIAL